MVGQRPQRTRSGLDPRAGGRREILPLLLAGGVTARSPQQGRAFAFFGLADGGRAWVSSGPCGSGNGGGAEQDAEQERQDRDGPVPSPRWRLFIHALILPGSRPFSQAGERARAAQ